MTNRILSGRNISRPNPPIASLGANIILGLAMLTAILIGTSDFSAKSIATDLVLTKDVQGSLIFD